MMDLYCIFTDDTVLLLSLTSSYREKSLEMAALFQSAVHPINRRCKHVKHIHCHFTVPSPDMSLCTLIEAILTLFAMYLMLIFIMHLLQTVTFHSISTHAQTTQEIIMISTHSDHLVVEKCVILRNTL